MLHTILDESELEQCLTAHPEQDIDAASWHEGNVMILGAGGNIGPSLAVRMGRAIKRAGLKPGVFEVVRKNKFGFLPGFFDWVEVVERGLLDLNGFDALPAAPSVGFMVGPKFGSKQDLPLTWTTNNPVGRSL